MMKESRRLAAARLWRLLFMLVTLVVAAILAYFTVMSIASAEVTIGPVVLEFKVRPSWQGSTIVELTAAGTLVADTHKAPAELFLP